MRLEAKQAQYAQIDPKSVRPIWFKPKRDTGTKPAPPYFYLTLS